ncbi:MAG: PaaI family thioesterase [Actinomycetota bacterium]|nr:PaaI family thioesterase [Actinomycetota bacterium]
MDGFAGDIGVREEVAEDGQARLEFVAASWHLNPAGTVHGGVLATLVDAAMGLAARSSTDDGEVPATSQLTIAYLTAGREGLMAVTAQVRKQGDHLLVCDADVEQDGKAVVHAVATFAVL